MIDRRFIPTDYEQKGNVCLLASYSVCLGFYKRIEYGLEAQLRFKSIIDKYINYMKVINEKYNSNELKEHLSKVEVFRSKGCSRKDVEESIYKMLDYYCHNVRDDIRGYDHIKEFNDYISFHDSIGLPCHYECILRYAEKKPVIGIHDIILQDLLECNSLAMIFYNKHSVVVGRGEDKTIYLRDTNNKNINVITEEAFTPELYPISEYIQFRQIDNKQNVVKGLQKHD